MKEVKWKNNSGIETEIYEVRNEFEFQSKVKIFSKKENQYKLLVIGNVCSEYSYLDIDSDGIFEILESSGGWNGSGDSYDHKVYSIKKGIYNEAFQFGTSRDDTYKSEYEFANSKLYISRNEMKLDKNNERTGDFELKSMEIYQFQKGEFKLIKDK